MIELDLQIGDELRHQLDADHARRRRRHYRVARWAQFLRGVVEAIAIVLLFIALGSLTRVVLSSQVATGSGSVDHKSALSEPWSDAR